MERRLLDALNRPIPSQSPSAAGSRAGRGQGWGAGGAAAQAPLHSGRGESPIFICIFAQPASPGQPHCYCYLGFFCCSRRGQCCIFRAQYLLGFTSAAEKAYLSSLMQKGIAKGNSVSPVAVVTSVCFYGNKLHTFPAINCMWSKLFLLYWEILFIQDVHSLFKVKLTSVEKRTSDLDLCLRTLLKRGFNVLTMHLDVTFTSIC